MKEKLFAFWRYDTFPYVLGGEIVNMRDDGRIATKEYPGYWFDPIKILPLAEGRKLFEKIDLLRCEYIGAEKKLKADYLARAKDICDFIPGK